MTVKVFLNDQQKATFKCPECEKSWTKDLSKFKNHEKMIRLKCKCPCGHSFPVQLEKRRHSRKSTNLGGAFIHDLKKYRGVITIKNLSKSGIGFEHSSGHFIHEGDRLELRFNLDDSKKSYICKEGIIRKIDGDYIGVEFAEIIREHDFLHPYIDES
jgi:hypothetical protein